VGKLPQAIKGWATCPPFLKGRAYGARKALFEEGGPLADLNFGTLATYGWVARQVETSRRLEVLSFQHHWNVAALSPREQKRWLARVAT
jgi:hypothetical protein